MEILFNKFIELATSEYGIFTGFLILLDFICLIAITVLWRRNEFLSNRFIDVIVNNTKVITKLVEARKRKDNNEN
jgi:hypothetical protein